jgi:hypothetical protein
LGSDVLGQNFYELGVPALAGSYASRRSNMTPRQRVLTAMQHEEPDRVPLFYRDVPEVRERLLKDLQLKSFDDLLEYFEIDFRWVEPEYIGPPLEDRETGIRRDIWGIEYKYVPFNETVGYWEAFNRPRRNVSGRPRVIITTEAANTHIVL